MRFLLAFYSESILVTSLVFGPRDRDLVPSATSLFLPKAHGLSFQSVSQSL